MSRLRRRQPVASMVHLLLCSRCCIAGATQDLRHDWNDKYCQIEGCKPASEALWSKMMRSNKSREELVFRNSLRDPLYHHSAVHDGTAAAAATRNGTVTTKSTRSVEYLGVMVDAGRHYFSIPWLHRLLDLMAIMNFNLLHLRLTDDQSFRVQLESSLHQPRRPNDAADADTYSVTDLKELVRYADARGILIMPEVTVPSHAGGWTNLGLTNMIVPCAEEICRGGFSLPLNLRHGNMTSMVKAVLQEIALIFDTSPFLHLGGNDVHLSAPCLEEVYYTTFPQEYQLFQNQLLDFVQNTLNKQVVQWQSALSSRSAMMDGPSSSIAEGIAQLNRFNEHVIRHFKTSDDYRLTAKPAEGYNGTSFCSDQQFNFDTNQDQNGYDAYTSTRAMVKAKQPLAVICDTQEMGMSQWLDRNVIGKLLAVSIGAAISETGKADLPPGHFFKLYDTLCIDAMQFDDRLCALRGRPVITKMLYSTEWRALDTQRVDDLCERLTTGKRKVTRQFKRHNKRKKRLADESKKRFWDELGEALYFPSSTLQPAQNSPQYDSLQRVRNGTSSAIRHSGLILDLVRIDDDKDLSRILSTLDLMNVLGLNTLQLRIMSDFGFVMEVPHHHDLQWGRNDSYYYSENQVERIVSHGTKLGIQVIPEIATATTGSGGWFGAGLFADCPNQAEDGIIAADATSTDFLTILVSLVRELVKQFHHPPFVHLGSDDREKVQACYNEAGRMIDLNDFERRLKKTMDFQSIDESALIRWENSRGASYPYSFGGVTESYMATNGNRETTAKSILALALIDIDTDAWKVYQQTRKLVERAPLGIMASVELVRDSFWNEFAITQRLVAFAMGLARNSMIKNEFYIHLKEAMSTLNVSSSNGEGRVSNATFARQMVQQDLKSRKKRACEERTVVLKKILPKIGVLV